MSRSRTRSISPHERARTVHRLPVATSLDDVRVNVSKNALPPRPQRNGKEANGKRNVSIFLLSHNLLMLTMGIISIET